MEKNIGTIYTQISNNPIIGLEQIPNIDLYMDQVTTFFDDMLILYKRYPTDKILTKTMINNYTKDHIIPAPIKKKYTKRHMILLILTYHLKSILSITDIKTIFVILEKLNNEEIQKFYLEFIEIQKNPLKEDFNFNSKELNVLLIILSNAVSANAKKQIIEKIIDSL